MMTWLRWQGALSFVVTLTFFLIIVWFFLDDWIEYNIESLGEELVGAKVTVEDVETSWLPLGFKLSGLEIADKSKPFENLIQVERIVAEVQGLDLLMGQVIINEMQVENMQLSIEREHSGALSGSKHQEHENEKNASPKKILDQVGINLPEPKEILENEKLQSISVGKALEDEYKHCVSVSDQARRAIPDKDKLKSYEDRLSKILKGKIKSIENYRQRKKLLSTLRNEIKLSKQNLLEAKKDLLACQKNLTEQTKALHEAPAEDLKRLKEKYQLSGGGARSVAKMLFDDQTKQWLDVMTDWYEKLAPVLLSGEDEVEPERLKGQFVYFPSYTTLPDFLIRHAGISATLTQGAVRAELRNITHQPEVLGRPIRLKVTGQSLQGLDELLVEGTIDIASLKSDLAFTFNGMKVSELDLLSIDGNQISLSEARANLRAILVLDNGVLNVNSETNFREVDFSGAGNKGFVRELGLALESVRAFNLNADINGPLNHLDIEIRSNLDRQLAKVFSRRLKQKQKKLEKELEQAINKKVAEFLQDKGINANQFNIDSRNLSASLDDNREYLEELLDKELDDFEKQQKIALDKKKKEELDRAKRKSKEEIKKQLKKLEFNF